MILLDTHVWVWPADARGRLSSEHAERIQQHRLSGLGVSVISCWEVAKLVEYGRLRLACAVDEWVEGALSMPGVIPIEITPRIAVESTRLPGTIHRDSADQFIIAPARVLELEMLTEDKKILKYPHVRAA